MDKKQIKTIEKEIKPIIHKVSQVEITNYKELEQASELLTKVSKIAKEVVAKKETVTKPLNAALKAARALFAPLEDQLDTAIMSLRKAITMYQTEEQRRAAQEALKITQKMEKGTITVEKAVAKLEQIDTPEKKVGSITFITVKKFEIENITQVPADYIMFNEVAVRQALNSGIKLPGIRYWEEQVPRVGR